MSRYRGILRFIINIMIKDQLKKDLVTAFKEGNAVKKSVISVLNNAIKNRELDKRAKMVKEGIAEAEADMKSVITDEEAVEVIMTEVKKRKESIAQFTAGGRPELAESEQAEIDVLMPYLPAQLSESEVEDIARQALSEAGITEAKDMGKAIGVVMSKVKGRTEGNAVSAAVKKILGA